MCLCLTVFCYMCICDVNVRFSKQSATIKAVVAIMFISKVLILKLQCVAYEGQGLQLRIRISVF